MSAKFILPVPFPQSILMYYSFFILSLLLSFLFSCVCVCVCGQHVTSLAGDISTEDCLTLAEALFQSIASGPHADLPGVLKPLFSPFSQRYKGHPSLGKL